MQVKENNEPNYDERVDEILRGLASGKTREDLADEFGHKTWKSVDMYMRRRNFEWDSEKKTYIPRRLEIKAVATDTTKASKVVLLLNKGDVDIRTTAQRLGFKDHHELAQYMNAKGYIWDSEQNNYIKMTGKIDEKEKDDGDENLMDQEREQAQNSLHSELLATSESINTEILNELQQYIPILRMIAQHKEELLDLIVPNKDTQRLPRYVVPGVAKTKTIQMINTLDQLVIDYSNEFNISQRNLFEVALIDFFRRYGYKQEVERLLN